MRIAHISDLHLGKGLHGFSLIEDQTFILDEIVSLLKKNSVDVLLVAGDIYDKNVASVEGLRLLRKFLNDIVALNIKVLLISGNHDSAERLTFGSEFMTEKGIYFSKIYDGKIEPVELSDEFGTVNFYLLPFIKPAIVKQIFPDKEIETYEDAVACAIKELNVDTTKRNVIVAHQNILNAERCESEENVIGGLDAVNADLFKDFDYTALGHIHKPQKIGENVYYSGTPIKYSISEINHEKTMPVLNFAEKGNLTIEFEQLKPLREIREITGSMDEILKMARKDPNNPEDFISIVLNDEEERLDAMATLNTVYPNIIRLIYDNTTTRNSSNLEELSQNKVFHPLEMFQEFYKARRGIDLTGEQKDYMQKLIEEIWGDEK